MDIEERFKSVYPRIQNISRKYSYAYPVPYEEYESMLCEEFLKVDASYDAKLNDSYSAYVGAKLDLVAKRLSGADRKERKFYDTIQYIEIPDADDEETKYPVELVSDVDIESQVFDVMFVEEQLAKATGDTHDILAAFFAEPNASFREIARSLGLNDKLVKRRLEAVAGQVRDA